MIKWYSTKEKMPSDGQVIYALIYVSPSGATITAQRYCYSDYIKELLLKFPNHFYWCDAAEYVEIPSEVV
jgi:hypothetical protein